MQTNLVLHYCVTLSIPPICPVFSSSYPEAFSDQSLVDQASVSTIRLKPQRISPSHFFLRVIRPLGSQLDLSELRLCTPPQPTQLLAEPV